MSTLTQPVVFTVMCVIAATLVVTGVIIGWNSRDRVAKETDAAWKKALVDATRRATISKKILVALCLGSESGMIWGTNDNYIQAPDDARLRQEFDPTNGIFTLRVLSGPGPARQAPPLGPPRLHKDTSA